MALSGTVFLSFLSVRVPPPPHPSIFKRGLYTYVEEGCIGEDRIEEGRREEGRVEEDRREEGRVEEDRIEEDLVEEDRSPLPALVRRTALTSIVSHQKYFLYGPQLFGCHFHLPRSLKDPHGRITSCIHHTTAAPVTAFLCLQSLRCLQ